MIVWEIKPTPSPRMVASDRYAERPVVVKYFNYRSHLLKLAHRDNYKIGDTLENITFVMPFPKSYSKKKKNDLNGKPHQIKPDLDNLVKAFKDSLLKNDQKVHTYNNIKKVWGFQGAIVINPHEVINGIG